MLIQLLKSKIHRARVTAANVNYEGSLTIDEALLERAGLRPYERILCGNMSNGARFETYAIPGPRGRGDIILNGAVARRGQPGDVLTIMSFALVEEVDARDWEPRVIVLDEANRVVSERGL
jgi:aspartate 1-decarboxylase